MTSFRQIEANRRNARNSTGPTTEEGKQRSRCNAVRHGLTAETVIGALEDAEDYKAFEAAIIADYDAQSAVERELVLRLASLLWRLRRATTMETGLFEIQADYLREFRQGCQVNPASREVVYALFGRADPVSFDPTSHGITNGTEAVPARGRNLSNLASIPPPTSRVAFCVSPICPATRSTDLAGMKQSFGAKPARSCSLSMHWIVANHKKETAAIHADAGAWDSQRLSSSPAGCAYSLPIPDGRNARPRISSSTRASRRRDLGLGFGGALSSGSLTPYVSRLAGISGGRNLSLTNLFKESALLEKSRATNSEPSAPIHKRVNCTGPRPRGNRHRPPQFPPAAGSWRASPDASA